MYNIKNITFVLGVLSIDSRMSVEIPVSRDILESMQQDGLIKNLDGIWKITAKGQQYYFELVENR